MSGKKLKLIDEKTFSQQTFTESLLGTRSWVRCKGKQICFKILPNARTSILYLEKKNKLT